MLKSLKRISRGFSLALKGLAGAWQQKELRRVYRLYVLGLSFLSFALFSSGLWGLFSLLDPTIQSEFWTALWRWLLLALGFLSLLLLEGQCLSHIASLIEI